MLISQLSFFIAKKKLISDGITQRAFENSAAHIRCDVSTNLPGDQALLVVWYKNNLPIYR